MSDSQKILAFFMKRRKHILSILQFNASTSRTVLPKLETRAAQKLSCHVPSMQLTPPGNMPFQIITLYTPRRVPHLEIAENKTIAFNFQCRSHYIEANTFRPANASLRMPAIPHKKCLL